MLHENLKEVNNTSLTCETAFYIGLGEEVVCGKKATHTINTGTEREYPLCADCIKDVPPSRIVKIAAVTPC